MARLIWFDPSRSRAYKPILAAIALGQLGHGGTPAFDHDRDRAHMPTFAVIAPPFRPAAARRKFDPAIYQAPKPPAVAYLTPAPAKQQQSLRKQRQQKQPPIRQSRAVEEPLIT